MSKTSDADLDAAREALQKAAEERTFGRKKASTKADKVRALRGDIAKLRTQGATWEELAEVLRPTLGVGADTIRLAISGPKKSGAKSKPEPRLKTRNSKRVTEPAPSAASNAQKKPFGSPEL